MKILVKFLALAPIFWWFGLDAQAAPPYDLTVTFTYTGTEALDGVNLYIDDCANTGATGAPVASSSSLTVSAPGAITADGTYVVCGRPFNVGGENPVATATTVVISPTPVPSPLDGIDVTVTCYVGGVVTPCADAGVDVTTQ